jgi:hypothetical protein
VQLDLKDHKVLQGHKEYKEQPVHREHKVPQVHKEQDLDIIVINFKQLQLYLLVGPLHLLLH